MKLPEPGERSFTPENVRIRDGMAIEALAAGRRRRLVLRQASGRPATDKDASMPRMFVSLNESFASSQASATGRRKVRGIANAAALLEQNDGGPDKRISLWSIGLTGFLIALAGGCLVTALGTAIHFPH
ncbi:hypothetical protein [Methylocystis heyeri]|uniref:Uncharacterized protein n=1 Tax=Methylocystis heyeri TaxID=391905 RepID=A0A6B8K8K9_9HYPH|nr:hypothetical protein [Methylocystis heyeri]QGM44249.1 hypothetical protein H2LOC_000210 [Methylocystis heyeri]